MSKPLRNPIGSPAYPGRIPEFQIPLVAGDVLTIFGTISASGPQKSIVVWKIDPQGHYANVDGITNHPHGGGVTRRIIRSDDGFTIAIRSVFWVGNNALPDMNMQILSMHDNFAEIGFDNNQGNTEPNEVRVTASL